MEFDVPDNRLPRKWKMRDGTKIYIRRMSTGHIRNSMRLLERYAKANKEYYDRVYSSDPGFSEDSQASVCFEAEQMEVWGRGWADYLPLDYEALRRELERRGEPT